MEEGVSATRGGGEAFGREREEGKRDAALFGQVSLYRLLLSGGRGCGRC